MNTIKLNIETKEIKGYDITQMNEMFGKRIKHAIYYSEPNSNGRSYAGLIHKKMVKLCKRWKFWNNDIRQAYKKYIGYMLMPYIVVDEKPIISGYGVDDEELNKSLNDELLSRYSKKEINYKNYGTFTSK